MLKFKEAGTQRELGVYQDTLIGSFHVTTHITTNRIADTVTTRNRRSEVRCGLTFSWARVAIFPIMQQKLMDEAV